MRHWTGGARVQLIVNPIAGRGLGPRLAPLLEGHLRRLGYGTSTFLTRRRDDARAFAASLDWRTSLIVVVGGDGTLNEVLNGQTRIPMTIFPSGTGNAFAADRGIRGTLDAFDALLRTGVVEWFDLGDAGGLLDVCMLPAPSGFDYLRWFLGVLRGRPLTQNGADCARAGSVHLTGRRVACHVDGEYIGLAPLSLSVLPRSVPILVPASPRPMASDRSDSIRDEEFPLAA